tara:strand:+ start:49260 stop:50567 length:1308 start_codon:yes stop_codon:yes gene_type:complete
MTKTVIIITALPFRIQGNQSLLRFTRMFLNNGYKVILYTTGNDDRGEITEKHPNLTFVNVPRFSSINKLNPLKLLRNNSKYKDTESATPNHYFNMKSADIVPPFGAHSKNTMFRKWISFSAGLIDNFLAFFYILSLYPKQILNAQAIIGYETGMAISAKFFSVIFNKKYINKYQGTVLEASKRNLSDAKKYYPSIYYGINKSDLCIMVNDDSDGEFYARAKGCENVLLTTHGVGVEDYKMESMPPKLITENADKFILFNNATGSRWKRTDRILRALALLPEEKLKNILLITTYFADDKEKLVEFCEKLGLRENVIFLEKINHIESNTFIQFSDALIMTNDMTNLGNPTIEALYYGTPVISLDERTLGEFVRHGKDGYLISINEDMDVEMANAISALSNDKKLYDKIKRSVQSNTSVHSLKTQQEKEFQRILDVLE